jgi:hypothetical protein
VAYLDVVSLVVVTTFTEEPVVHNTVDVELIEQRVTVLCLLAFALAGKRVLPTFDTDAVKTTTS